MHKTSLRMFPREPRRRRVLMPARITDRTPLLKRDVVHPILELQRSVGNQAVRRMLQRHLLASTATEVRAPIVQRAVEFNSPGNPNRQDPIPLILASRQTDLGLTTPSINGRPLPAHDLEAAGRMILTAITPSQVHRVPPPAGTGSGSGSGSGSASPVLEYQFADFTMQVSANVNLPTVPSGGKWGSEVIDIPTSKAPPKCEHKGQVPVTMEGDPSSNALATLIQNNEQEHVNDIQAAVNAHLAPAYNWLMSLRGRGATDQQSQDDLFRQANAGIGGRVRSFLDAIAAAVTRRDARGGHSVCGETEVKGDCDRLVIKVKKGLCPH